MYKMSSGAPQAWSVCSTARDVRALDARGELAIRKRARAAFAKLHVALPVQRAARPEGFHIARALFHALAALEHHGPRARLRQGERGEQPRRAQPDHRRARAPFLPRQGRDGGFPGLLRAGHASPRFHIQRVHKVYVAPVARVHGLFAHAHAQHLALGDFQRPGGDARKRRVQPRGHVVHSIHHLRFAASLPASKPLAQAHCRL